MERNRPQGYLRHRLAWKLLRPLLHGVMQPRYRFHARPQRGLPQPCLVFSNHVALLDPLLICDSFPQQMYYVASEHILRRSIAPLMTWLGAPLLRRKSRTEANTAMDILRRLRAGCNVCVFIEGERSFAGQTEFIPDSAAHLAKMCGCSLVTYRIENGYLTEPRWSLHTRPNGSMTGHVVRVYSPQELEQMSREQVLQAIRGDLWLDAYERQELQPLAYPGPKLAESLETVLFLCPCCGSVGRLKSRDDRFWCQDCELDLRYTEFGYLESNNHHPAPYTTVRDWFNWQRQAGAAYALAHRLDPQPLACDPDQELYAVDAQTHQPSLLGRGQLALYGDRLEFTATDRDYRLSLGLEEITNLSCHERTLLSFSVKQGKSGLFFESDGPVPRSPYKYQLLFRTLRDRLREERRLNQGG